MVSSLVDCGFILAVLVAISASIPAPAQCGRCHQPNPKRLIALSGGGVRKLKSGTVPLKASTALLTGEVHKEMLQLATGQTHALCKSQLCFVPPKLW